MQLPNWLAGLTGANKFANNPLNGFQATLGDLGQSAVHSMLQHYRGKGGTYGGPAIIEGLNGGPGTATPIPEVMPTPSLASILPAKPIEGSELAPVTSPLPPPPAPPPPQMTPEARSALTAQLNGGSAWGQQPGMTPAPAATGIPLSLLLRLGLR